MTNLPDNLLDQSRESRNRAYRGASIGTRNRADEELARRGYPLITAAVSMAAGGRVRRGRYVSDEDRQDAAATLLLDLAAGTLDGGRLQDQERPTMPDSDGGHRMRPSPDLIAAAGAALDELRRQKDGEMPADLEGFSRESRKHSTAKRDGRDQLVTRDELTRANQWHRLHPAANRAAVGAAADPLPPEAAGAADSAGIWPGDYLRAAIAAEVTTLPVTPADWQETSYGAGKTTSALQRGVERATAKLLEIGAADSTVASFAALLRDAIAPTDEEHAEHAARGVASLLTADEDGATKCRLPDKAWRDAQPFKTPLRVMHAAGTGAARGSK